MKRKSDLVHGWLRKSQSDLDAMKASIGVGSYDAACFHAQQAAEKALKAFLLDAQIDFPFTHNLSKLVELCARENDSFSSLSERVEPLTPYAVEMRYDAKFWPDVETAEQASDHARCVVDLVLDKLHDKK